MMKDTAPDIETRFYLMMMKKSGQERLMMGFSMYNMVRQQVEESIRANKPNADIKHIRKEIFLRFYGHEYSHEEQEKILREIIKDEIWF